MGFTPDLTDSKDDSFDFPGIHELKTSLLLKSSYSDFMFIGMTNALSIQYIISIFIIGMIRKFISFKICSFKHRRNFVMEVLSCLSAISSIDNPNCKDLII